MRDWKIDVSSNECKHHRLYSVFGNLKYCDVLPGKRCDCLLCPIKATNQ